MKRKKPSAYWRTEIALFCLAALLALIGLFPKVCDRYTDSVYGIIADGLGRLTARLPFALGEILMYLGILLLVLGLIFLILLIFLRKKPKYRKFCAGYYKSFLMALTVLLVIEAGVWFVPFRGELLGGTHAGARTEFTYEEIAALMQFAVDGVNAAAEEIEISPDGKVDFPTEAENLPKIADAMHALAGEYPRLAGYYPPIKTALCSDILERMNIGGYTYPFTMELTHNRYSFPSYRPVLDAHESAHHQGYYKENEATFLSELALSQSDDPFLRYSGFMDMYDYVYFDYWDARNLAYETAKPGQPMPESPEEWAARAADIALVLGAEPFPSDRAYWIYDAACEIEQVIYEADPHPIDDLPAVDNVITETADIGWSTQAAVLQENTYDGVTLLLLQYFDGKLY